MSQQLLSCHFTSNTSQSHVTFLDVDVHINQGQLRTSVHIKPNNHQQYLHYHSCHPISTTRSIPNSLATRGQRTSFHPEDLHIYTCNLTKAFASRGYPVSLIQKQLSQALHHSNTNPRTSRDPITFPSPLLIIQASTASNGSLEKASTSSPQIHPPRTCTSNPPVPLSTNPKTSTNLLWTPASALIILPPPPAPDPATDPRVRPAPFTPWPAHVPTSLTP